MRVVQIKEIAIYLERHACLNREASMDKKFIDQIWYFLLLCCVGPQVPIIIFLRPDSNLSEVSRT